MDSTIEKRAFSTHGTSTSTLYRRVTEILSRRTSLSRNRILDLGCGTAELRNYVAPLFKEYVGADLVRHQNLPPDVEFCQINLDSEPFALPSESFDAVVGIEVIEHLENPRLLVREMCRLCKKGGIIVITTPNQLSLLSKGTLLLKNEFNAFRNSSYPAHITALLEVDLLRISRECGLVETQIDYSQEGRIPFTSLHFPKWISHLLDRQFSDQVILSGIK